MPERKPGIFYRGVKMYTYIGEFINQLFNNNGLQTIYIWLIACFGLIIIIQILFKIIGIYK